MLLRTALALLLLLPAAISAQDLDAAVSAVVRISGTRGGTSVRGSGFVIGLDRDKATIVTAAHVVEGVQQLEVTFGVDLTESFPVSVLLGMEAGNPNGLAALQVRGSLPVGVTSLSFEVGSRPGLGDSLFLLGFPQMELAPRTTQRVLSGRRGTLLLVDQGIGEGFSGGPVLRDGKVVGVVTDTDGQTTFAVNAVVAREALEGWGLRLVGQGSTPVPNTATQTKPPAPVEKKCVPGEERSENGITFVRICTGSFSMGSAPSAQLPSADEQPLHKVTLSEFWIGKTEVTNEQYRLFYPDHPGEDKLPATGVRWDHAKEACEHFGGRLPTEAEWEYAARAGSESAWSFGDNMRSEYAWYDQNSGGRSHPVGTTRPNTWGIHDMHGNVWEWVADWYGTYSGVAQTDPTGPATGQDRVLRGGAFNDSPWSLRSAYRFMGGPMNRDLDVVGFRCVRGSRPL